jgi:hypothetical protein
MRVHRFLHEAPSPDVLCRESDELKHGEFDSYPLLVSLVAMYVAPIMGMRSERVDLSTEPAVSGRP